MTLVIDVLVLITLLIGVAFMTIGALGLVRLPDLYTRMSASTKASTLGSAFLLISFALHFNELGVSMRALVVIVFLFLTTPVAAHLIGRAAYLNGVQLWEESIVNELAGYYDGKVKRPVRPLPRLSKQADENDNQTELHEAT